MPEVIWNTARPIVLASGNPHKLEEMNKLLAGRLNLISLATAAADRGVTISEPAEPGLSFEANAAIKAVSYARQLGMACLADDSGLEIAALGGKPGVISSHYCTDGAEVGMSRSERDAANNKRVLSELGSVPLEQRGARFVCVLCIAEPAGADEARVVMSIRGTFDGRIGLQGQVPRGENGFGYDPLFLVAPEFVRTSAELTADDKNQRSHRAAAAARLLDWIVGQQRG